MKNKLYDDGRIGWRILYATVIHHSDLLNNSWLYAD